MPTWISRFVAAPVFEGNEDKTRIASLLNTLILSVLACAMFSNIAAPVVYSRPTVGWMIAGIVMLLCFGELFLIRRGHVHVASLLFLSGLWAFFTLMMYVSGGTTSFLAIGYVTVTITAGLLLGGYVAMTVAGVSIVTGLWILYVEGSGRLPAPILSVNMGSGWLNLTANLLAAAAVLYLATRSIDNALERARSSEHAQIETNRELIAIREALEVHVADRTRDLAARSAELEEANLRLETTLLTSQRRATLLEAIAQVSRAVAQIRDLDQLLPQVTQLISQHFGFYHVGIFLIDAASHFAVLRAANSQGGQRMLARTHRLAVGSQGIVGYVTGTGEPRIALDVDTDAVFFDNPDLPDTRSEMAAPLRVGDEIIGALDVQSTQEAAFDQEDIALLTIMADQIAIAIDNARLFHQTQEALEETQEAYRRYLRQEWDSFLGRRAKRPATGQIGTLPMADKVD